jgi:hypothetical protein
MLRSPFMSVLRLGAQLVLPVLLSACGSTTMLLANFNSDVIGQPPAHQQAVGTVAVFGSAPNGVEVVQSPLPDLPRNRWARIGFPARPPAELKGEFSHFAGEGDYTLASSLFIRGGAGIATVQFEAFNTGTSVQRFLHLDFMPDGTVRVDDGPVVFGQFPKDKPFALTVHLNIRADGTTAEITLFGEGAGGSTQVEIDPVARGVARRFGAVRFWLAFDQPGQFFVDDILVTRKQ